MATYQFGRNGVQFALTCLIMAALSGLIGFVIVYHFATYERPVQRFAIVIDAGSTQTRSSLFAINLNTLKLIEWTEAGLETETNLEAKEMPLSQLVQVKQLSHCINGGPVASLQSEAKTRELIEKCIKKFARHIKQLDFHQSSEMEDSAGKGADHGDDPLDDELSEQMALQDHRVYSLTHIHLGATAGMRALQELNRKRAAEKLSWLERTLNETQARQPIKNGPVINKGFVGIISGEDEAAFGWSSVNFVCNRLNAGQLSQLNEPQVLVRSAVSSQDNKNSQEAGNPTISTHYPPQTVGTLELGGSSAQMAFQLAQPNSDHDNAANYELNLFNRKYQLATRSDLCLGMSQAVLRANFVLLRDHYNQSSDRTMAGGSADLLHQVRPSIELQNPCLQRASRTSLGQREINELLRAPCLVGSQLDAQRELFKAAISRRPIVRLVGTGNTTQCDQLLAKLLDPSICQRYFSLCPQSDRNKRATAPPSEVPFVTISGYNKALQVLQLKPSRRKQHVESSEVKGSRQQLESLIADRLGGQSIEQADLIEETRKFCALDVSELPLRFPTMNPLYYVQNCLQLVYINKLLSEFYLFNSNASWSQIKFLLFESSNNIIGQKDEIGWTLGLLLNATSEQLSSSPSGNGEQEDLFYHHGASVKFALRATFLIMFACVLIAVSLIVVSVLVGKQNQRCAYINH